MTTFTTTLSSSKFAYNCAEGDPVILARLFDGMTVETAKNIFAAPHRVARNAANTLDVPDDMVVEAADADATLPATP